MNEVDTFLGYGQDFWSLVGLIFWVGLHLALAARFRRNPWIWGGIALLGGLVGFLPILSFICLLVLGKKEEVHRD